MTRSPRLVGAVAAPALAAVLALALSSCSTPEAGAAATVGNHRISVSQVQDAYRDIVPIVGQDQQVTQTQILNLLILEPFLTQAASEEGRGISIEDAQQDIKSAGPAAATAHLSTAGLEVWRANLANSAIQSNRTQDQVQATYQGIGVKLKQAGVHINPRYGGGINYTNFSITPTTSNWLVTKAPVAAVNPGPTPTP